MANNSNSRGVKETLNNGYSFLLNKGKIIANIIKNLPENATETTIKMARNAMAKLGVDKAKIDKMIAEKFGNNNEVAPAM